MCGRYSYLYLLSQEMQDLKEDLVGNCFILVDNLKKGISNWTAIGLLLYCKRQQEN